MLLLFLGLTLTNCQLEEEPLKHENQINTLNYKNDILSYLKNLRKKSNKELSAKIEELATSFDHSSLKIYDLKSTQKILIGDVRSLTGLENSDKIKTVFFMIDNKIVRSRIVTFNNKTLFDDYDKVILSILDRNKNENLYSGKISFYSLPQNILLSNEFENGKLTINGILNIKNNKSKTARANGCIDWYWVTTYQDGSQTSEYLYTTCDSCEEMANKLLTTNSCGGGGSGGGTGSGPNFPFSPNINQIYDYFSPEGEHIRYQFINNIWKIILISLPDIVVKSVPESRPYLVFDWPQDQQKVYAEGFVFTYESQTGSWVGEPTKDPCQTASITTALSKESNYISAKTSIQTAAADGFEHSITLGKDANGQITQAPMNTGGPYNVATNTSWAGAFAALHNHPNNSPVSAGDIYASVKLNEKSGNFTTTFVLTDGEVYGIVVTDLAAAQAFVTTYPADQLPGYSPEFPNFIFDQIEAIQTSDMTYTSIEGKTQAISIILDKYNSGITLLKQDNNGNFNPIKMEETVQNGNTMYTQKPCN